MASSRNHKYVRTAEDENEEGFHSVNKTKFEPNKDTADAKDGQVYEEEDESDDHDDEEYQEASPIPMTASTSSNPDDHTFLVHSLGSVDITDSSKKHDCLLDGNNLKEKMYECLTNARIEMTLKAKTPTTKTDAECQQMLMKIENSRIKLTQLKTNQLINSIRISKIIDYVMSEETNDLAFITDDAYPQQASDLLVPNVPKCHMFHCEDDGLESSVKRINYLISSEIERINNRDTNKGYANADANKDAKLTKSNSLDGRPTSLNVKSRDSQKISPKEELASNISTPDVEFLPQYVEDEVNVVMAKYVGSYIIDKPSGVDILNGAIEKVVYEVNHRKNNSSFSSDAKHKDAKNRDAKVEKLDEKIDIEDEDALNGNMIPSGKHIKAKLDAERDAKGDANERLDEKADANGDANDDENLINIPCSMKISATSIIVSKVHIDADIGIPKDRRQQEERDADENILFEVRIRYLSFLGISRTDSTKCAFIHQLTEPINEKLTHAKDVINKDLLINKEESINDSKLFVVRVFETKNEIESSIICKHLETACQVRYQKCLDGQKNRMKSSMSVPINLKLPNSKNISNVFGKMFSKMWPSK